jgi:hypothetical protein
MADTKFDICSRALTMIGGQRIASFDDDLAEAEVARDHYEDVVLTALTVPGGKPYRWRFASDLRSLPAPVSGEPTDKWDHAYNLPNDMLELVGVTVEGSPIRYARYGNKVLCDEPDGIVVEILFRPDESRFPPSFRAGVTHDLASRFALALAQDPVEASRLGQKAAEYYGAARTLDSQQQPPRRIRPGRLSLAPISGS